jgi:hypothetical protein
MARLKDAKRNHALPGDDAGTLFDPTLQQATVLNNQRGTK